MSYALGADKVAAGKLNITVDEYQRRKAAGLKWCGGGHWKALTEFGLHTEKYDGKRDRCRTCTNADEAKREAKRRAESCAITPAK